MKKQRMFTHIREHASVYIVLTIVMLLGVVKGSIDLMNLTDVTVIRLGDYIKNLFTGSICKKDVFFEEVVTIAKIFLGLWVSGVCLLGSLIVAYIIYLKGYALGFLSTVLIKTMGIKGIGMIAMVVLSKEIFLIPIILALSVKAIYFSVYILNSKKMIHNKSILRELVHYGLYGVAYATLALSVVAINAELLSNAYYKKIIETFIK